MFEYLKALKKELLNRISLLLISFFLLNTLFLLYILKGFSPNRTIVYLFVFILIFVCFYVSLSLVLKHFLTEKLNKQENISRSLFKNTRNVINNISHELRTPLNAIMGFSASLYETEENIERKEALKAVKDNSDRLFAMTKKLVDFSSIETGQYEIEREYIKNDLLLSNLENKNISFVEKKGLKLTTVNEVPSHYSIFTDYNALFEVLEMIVENAVKFTEEGGVTIKSSYAKGFLNYVICDTGPGVPEDKKNQIFQLYRQVNSDLDREYEGLGLGLTIAEKLTELLGGVISLSDNHPHGSCFEISIKTEISETDGELKNLYSELLPKKLKENDIVYLRNQMEKLSEYIKVFNPERIRFIAEQLVLENKKFTILADRIIKTANTYDETEFLHIIEEMIKGTSDEE